MAISTFSELKTAVANWLENDSLTSRIPEFVAMAEDRIALDPDLRIRSMEANTDLVIGARNTLEASEVTGTADAIILTPDTAATAYTTGDRYRYVSEFTNTGTTPTVDISSLGTKVIKKYIEGSLQALEAGDIVNAHTIDLYYDGTQFVWVPRGGIPLPGNFLGVRRIIIQGSPNIYPEFQSVENYWSMFLSSEVGRPEAYTIDGDHILFGPDSNSALAVKLLYWRRFTALSADGDTNWILTNARGLLLYATLLEAQIYLEDDESAFKFSELYGDMVTRIEASNKQDRYASLTSRTDIRIP